MPPTVSSRGVGEILSIFPEVVRRPTIVPYVDSWVTSGSCSLTSRAIVKERAGLCIREVLQSIVLVQGRRI
jgi:hypothetical protein